MENKIYRIITSEEYSTLLEKLEDKNFKAQELSNFLIIDNNERKHMKTYIAIDNTTGDLWTEEFSSFEHAIEYLEGIIQVDEVHAMYKERSNWLEKFEKQENKLSNLHKLLEKAYNKIDKGLYCINHDELERQVAEGMNDILEAQNTLKELVNMKTYTIEIEEVLSRVVEVEATSVEEAQDIVYEQYRNEEIILDDGDYDGMPNIREIK